MQRKEAGGASRGDGSPKENDRQQRQREREKEQEKAQQVQLPLTPAKVLRYYMEELMEYEQGEILDFPQIWFFGAGAAKVRGTSLPANNHSYDDERGDYHVVLHDHVLYRYEVMNPLGKGSFGQVVRVFDHKTSNCVALKMVRNKKRFHHQALVEVKILEHIRERDIESTSNVVHMTDYFYFRNHLCITFELLSINLYEFIKNNNFQGVSLGLIRRFAIQLLAALRFLRKQHIIHCDLKPENVLLKNPTKSGIKVIDFGSSCFEDERVYTYIQSRFYRSPEVILGIPYDVAIDMWSFAGILAELYTGYPLFPGENEMEQLACIMEVCNVPPPRILESATRVKMFFDSSGNPRLVPNSRGKTRRPGSKDMQMVLRTSDAKFVDFLQGCLQWGPRERFTPEDALQHDWILEGYARHSARREARATEQQAPSSSSSKRRNSGLASLGSHKSQAHNEARNARGARSPVTNPSHKAAATATHTVSSGNTGSFVFPPIESGLSAGVKALKIRAGKSNAVQHEGGPSINVAANSILVNVAEKGSGPGGAATMGVSSGATGGAMLGVSTETSGHKQPQHPQPQPPPPQAQEISPVDFS